MEMLDTFLESVILNGHDLFLIHKTILLLRISLDWLEENELDNVSTRLINVQRCWRSPGISYF